VFRDGATTSGKGSSIPKTSPYLMERIGAA
jgi:hypothetical protein